MQKNCEHNALSQLQIDGRGQCHTEIVPGDRREAALGANNTEENFPELFGRRGKGASPVPHCHTYCAVPHAAVVV